VASLTKLDPMLVLECCRSALVADGSLRGRRIAVILPAAAEADRLANVLADAGAAVTAGRPGEPVPGRPEVIVGNCAAAVQHARTDSGQVLLGASEDTTAGLATLAAQAAAGTLAVPCVATALGRCRRLFVDGYGRGQTVVTALCDATNLLLAGKRVVVVGYGAVGQGIARRARGLGAEVIVCEIEPVAALLAHHDGFDVAPLFAACATAQVVLAATGVRGVLSAAALDALPDDALVASAGAADELDLAALRDRADGVRSARPHVQEVVLPHGRSVFVVDLLGAATDGAEPLDLTLAGHALVARYLLHDAGRLVPGVHAVPYEIDARVAGWQLETLGLAIDASPV
jgi:adenosylhomocysteinase